MLTRLLPREPWDREIIAAAQYKDREIQASSGLYCLSPHYFSPSEGVECKIYKHKLLSGHA